MKNKLTTVFNLLMLSTAITMLFALQQGKNQSPHGEMNYSCTECHSLDSWETDLNKMTFDHATTQFPLTGQHQQVSCRECHQSLVFHEVGSSCADCHPDIHENRLGMECQHCHTPMSWENQRDMIDAHLKKGFPLTGTHLLTDCESCHIGEGPDKFEGTDPECFSCHQEIYLTADNPDHRKAMLGNDCLQCHHPTAITWKNTSYTHPPVFVLRGGHRHADCIDCHKDQYRGTDPGCQACHLSDFQSTDNPNHIIFGFPTDCQICHTEYSWQNDLFDHQAVTGFALDGAHATITCTSCHINNQVTGLPDDCFGCHQTDFESTTNPDHQSAGFSQDCPICHNTGRWTPAEFDHSGTGFSLTGLHIALDCNACHLDGYAGTPTDCFSCHQEDYQRTTDPNHVIAGFSTRCEGCHDPSGWENTTWDHDASYFPIFSGKHRQAWTTCSECHVNQSDYKVFECIFCHKHNQSDTDGQHDEVNGYSYNSQECYRCHPDGTADDDKR